MPSPTCSVGSAGGVKELGVLKNHLRHAQLAQLVVSKVRCSQSSLPTAPAEHLDIHQMRFQRFYPGTTVLQLGELKVTTRWLRLSTFSVVVGYRQKKSKCQCQYFQSSTSYRHLQFNRHWMLIRKCGHGGRVLVHHLKLNWLRWCCRERNLSTPSFRHHHPSPEVTSRASRVLPGQLTCLPMRSKGMALLPYRRQITRSCYLLCSRNKHTNTNRNHSVAEHAEHRGRGR